MLGHMLNSREKPRLHNSLDLLKQVAYVESVATERCGGD